MTEEERQESGKIIRLEKATIGINAIAGAALMILIALVADVRASISALAVKCDQAIRDVAVLHSQNLDSHIRDLERRMAVVEANKGGPNR